MSFLNVTKVMYMHGCVVRSPLLGLLIVTGQIINNEYHHIYTLCRTYNKMCRTRANRIMKDTHHPKNYSSFCAKTNISVTTSPTWKMGSHLFVIMHNMKKRKTWRGNFVFFKQLSTVLVLLFETSPFLPLHSHLQCCMRACNQVRALEWRADH